jgi:hypothetical protein
MTRTTRQPGSMPADCRPPGLAISPAQRLYEAEVALHIAHQTHDDAWITAASDKLHEAVVAFLAACHGDEGGRS